MKCCFGVGENLAWPVMAALLCLFTAQSHAADVGLSRLSASVNQLAHPASGAQPTDLPKVVWPDNGIAQRRLEGGFNYNMFVENDNGTWRAWVQSDMNEPAKKNWARAKALDFFSGKEQAVRATVDDYTLQQTPGFIDKKGYGHGPEGSGFMFIRGSGVVGLQEGRAEFSLEGSRCSVKYLGGYQDADGGSRPSWTKVPLIYDKPTIGNGGSCIDGDYSSNVYSTLDLNDGTFLVTMECWIFRLGKSDLSPVGEAPALRVVDGAVLRAAIDQAKGQHIEDAPAYLGQVLGLRFEEADACRR